ncbi:alpha/beta fold hydrolase [Lederbergia panacisoli]|uniref:alpha/beta fold hydrolase n=1 Tax=Lederbergia panacisoli TaxID=1255251 RepID=UPI00214C2963|nr:alpha/beta hydrolase [Lederbergia panacisoli]MCR2823637.1 alpha/beta hydrolase [Lederbergia panacisoli]
MSYLVFNNEDKKQSYYESYDQSLKQWDVETESLYIDTSFGKTHVITCGPEGAPPLVLIHGMTVSSTMWFANAPDWSQQFRVFAIDVMGDFGKSECTKPISSPEHIDSWLNETLDALNLNDIHLVGHSMGGWISLQFSLNSNRVKKLALLAPVMSFAGLNWKFPMKLFPAMTVKNSFFIRSLFNWMFAKQNQPDEILYQQFYKGYKYGKIQLRIAPKVFERDELEGLKPDTLVLIGEQEVVYSSTKKAVEYANSFTKIKAKLIPNCSHCLPAEQREIVNQLVKDFLIS